jgi:hypothetical protein
MFVVEFFARGSVPSVRDVLADSVAEAEATASNASKGASSKIGCTGQAATVTSDNYVATSLQSKVRL